MGRRATWFGLGALLAATAAAYLPSLDGDFVLDDYAVIGDPLVTAPGAQPLAAWLASPRPLLTATFALDHALGGLAPRGWHLVNLLVHLAAVLLAWRVASRLLRRAGLSHPGGAALLTAGLFALHPLQTEAVSYLAQRGEALASALSLAALLALLARDEAAAPGRRSALLAAAAGLLAAGLLVKPIGVTLPLAWLLVAALLPAAAEAGDPPLARLRRRLPAAAPLLALAVGAAAWGLTAAAGSSHAGLGMAGVTSWQYLATQLTVVPVYLSRLAWPAGQCADCAVPWRDGLLDPATLAGGALLAALLAAAHWLARSARGATGDGAAARRLPRFGLLFFLLALVPTSSVVPLRDPLVEHRAYLAALGPFLAVSALAAAALRRLAPARAPVLLAALGVALLAAAGAATARRNAVWASALAFHQDAAAKAPEKARVHLNLGTALLKAQRHEEAAASLRRAAALQADLTVSPRQVFDALQVALLNAGRHDEARQAALEALAAAPTDPWALGNLAEVELVSGRPAAAEEAARLALRGDAGSVKALKYLGLARAEQGDAAGAAEALGAAAARSQEPGIHLALGLMRERLGDRAGACRALARSVELATHLGIPARAGPDQRRLGCR